jgi:hypothetical protein
VVKTWSPAGEPAELTAPLQRDHLSVIGGVTWEGKLFVQVHEKSVNAEGAIAFVLHLLRHIPGRILLLWDGSRIHESRKLATLRQLDHKRRLVIEKFPAYAPEVDPQEYVWHQLKHVEFRNLTSYSMDQMRARIQAAVRRLRRRVALLKNLVHHAGLST